MLRKALRLGLFTTTALLSACGDEEEPVRDLSIVDFAPCIVPPCGPQSTFNEQTCKCEAADLAGRD